ncbi:MAG TPA: YciI family protein [Myxococcaceae bacterium]|nr:YciI family protein [Myxococcaceae bacterium]
MSDFLLLYRLPADSPDMPDSPQRMQERLERWRAWFGELEAKGHLKVLGHPLEMGGAVVKDGGGTIHDGPYAESKDILIGYSVVQTRDLAEANAVASRCPVLAYGGMVEVRPIRQM